MPWTSDLLPWGSSLSKPPRPSGIYESLNYFPGTPVLAKSGQYPDRSSLQHIYRAAPITPGMSLLAIALRTKG